MKKGFIQIDWLRIFSLDSLFQVSQQTSAIVERFGNFVKTGRPGINIKIPLIDQIAYVQTLRIQQLDVKVGTKTKDNVFVDIVASVQYRVEENPQKIYDSFYKLENVVAQVNSYVFDVIRAEIPKMKLDEVFEKKDEIARAIKKELSAAIEEFGYEIVKTLVTDIDVDARIMTAMNEIVASEREKMAAIEKGEAEKIRMIKRAEAEAESKHLQGQGIANQRKAIMEGYRESIEAFQRTTKMESPQEVMNLVLMTQYFDTLKDVAQADSNTILMPHTPSMLSDIYEQIRNAMATGTMIANASGKSVKTQDEKKESS